MAGRFPSVQVGAPAVTPYEFGLYSVAALPPEPGDQHWQGGVEYETEACSSARSWADECDPELTPDPKLADPTMAYVSGSPFTVYAGPQCDLVGNTLDRMAASARRALELGEQRAVEEAFWTGALGNYPSLAGSCCAPEAGDQPDPPGDLLDCCGDGAPCCVILNATPDAEGALTLTAAVAELEKYAAANYAGTPILHSPRDVAAYAAAGNLLDRDGGRRVTRSLGSPWAFYGAPVNTGPCATAAPPGMAWIFATGAVVLRRSEIFMTPPGDRLVQAAELRLNRAQIIAERTVILTRECLCAAVLVALGT